MENKTMSDYSIYCTPEQTKKSFELGAPWTAFGYGDLGDAKEKILKMNRQAELYPTENGGIIVGQIPTAEQMIGWMEEQDVAVDVCMASKTYGYYSLRRINDKGTIDYICRCDGNYSSRKEATLAAIGVALEYLSNNKK